MLRGGVRVKEGGCNKGSQVSVAVVSTLRVKPFR